MRLGHTWTHLWPGQDMQVILSLVVRPREPGLPDARGVRERPRRSLQLRAATRKGAAQNLRRFMVSAEVPLAECAARSAEANLKLLDFLRRVVLASYVFISFLRLRCVLPV